LLTRSRLERLRGTVVQAGEELVVMQDVQGNEFCVERCSDISRRVTCGPLAEQAHADG